MKKTFLLTLLLSFPLWLCAQRDMQRFMLQADFGYGYNCTWQHYGWVDIAARLPINPYFEMETMAQANIADVYTLGVNVRPKFPVRVGEMFLETRLLYKAVVRTRLHDFSGGFSVGYRMDYVSVQLGIAGRIMEEMQVGWHTENRLVFEPVMLYALEVFVRPQACRWNLGARIANFDNWQTERFFQPLFMLNGRVDVTDKIRLLMGIECKPTGMFHLNAAFYDAQATVGVAYFLNDNK